MPLAPVNGLELYYERGGTGPRLLFINGSGATLAASGLIMTTLAARFDVVGYDQRGLGRSHLPERPYGMAELACDAVGLADHLGWERFRVIGVSFGGMVAQELAVSAPDRVERLALVCTSPGGEQLSSYPLHELVDLEPDDRARRFVAIVDTRFDADWLDGHPDDRTIAQVLAASQRATKPERVRAGEALQMRARRDHDVTDRLHLVACPTLVACGRYDGIAPPANGEAIAARVPGAEMRVFEGGHLFTFQDPSAWPAIQDFLAGA